MNTEALTQMNKIVLTGNEEFASLINSRRDFVVSNLFDTLRFNYMRMKDVCGDLMSSNVHEIHYHPTFEYFFELSEEQVRRLKNIGVEVSYVRNPE